MPLPPVACCAFLAVLGVLGACSPEGESTRVRITRGHPAVLTSAADAGGLLADAHDASDVDDGDGLAPDAAQTDGGDSDTRSEADDTSGEDAPSGDVDGGGLPSEGASCRVGAVVGTCLQLDACPTPAVALEGFCAGGPRVRCCLAAEDRCSAARIAGACLATARCTGADFTTTPGLCPGASDIRCCHPTRGTFDCGGPPDASGVPVVRPEDTPVPVEAGPEEPGDPGCPPGMADLGAFCIDRHEAALVRADSPGVTLSPFVRPSEGAPIRAVSVRHVVPQGHIDGVSAARACLAAGKRLCTSDEWRLACQGTEGRLFPYGAIREPGRCNDARITHPAVEYFGTGASWIWSELDHPCISQLLDSIHLTGEDAGCVSPEGVFDLVGNRHEWVDDPAGTFLGGFFADTRINGEGCLYRTTAHSIGHWDYSTGFRCCADR